MATETARMNGVGHEDDARQRRSVSDLAHDVVELMDLQSRLFLLDVRESAKTSITGVVLVLAGAVVLLSGMTALLFALAWLLYELAEWPRSAAFATAGGAGLLLAAIVAWVGIRKLRAAANTFKRSGRELSQNLQWFRDTWKRSPDRQGPNPK